MSVSATTAYRAEEDLRSLFATASESSSGVYGVPGTVTFLFFFFPRDNRRRMKPITSVFAGLAGKGQVQLGSRALALTCHVGRRRREQRQYSPRLLHVGTKSALSFKTCLVVVAFIVSSTAQGQTGSGSRRRTVQGWNPDCSHPICRCCYCDYRWQRGIH